MLKNVADGVAIDWARIIALRAELDVKTKDVNFPYCVVAYTEHVKVPIEYFETKDAANKFIKRLVK